MRGQELWSNKIKHVVITLVLKRVYQGGPSALVYSYLAERS